MTPQQIEAMKLALDLATMHHTDDGYAALRAKVRSASKEALAQPEQEPVAWFSPSGNLYKTRFHATANGEQVVTPLYTSPPQRKPLTHEQRFDVLTKFEPHKHEWHAPAILIDLVEAAHGIKE